MTRRRQVSEMTSQSPFSVIEFGFTERDAKKANKRKGHVAIDWVDDYVGMDADTYANEY